MDPVALAFYAVVCGVLAAFAPSFGARAARAVAGIVTGLVAALSLPHIRALLGL